MSIVRYLIRVRGGHLNYNRAAGLTMKMYRPRGRAEDMPTVEQNIKIWGEKYAWSGGGDEWSAHWGGPRRHWQCTVAPRIAAFVPAGTILEIGPGFGKWTELLRGRCGRLEAVDLSPKCVAACQRRFADCENVRVHQNDGRSLEMIADGSVDFAFSFDSLVHAETGEVGAYLRQLADKFSDDGVGLLHHSNIGRYLGYFAAADLLPERPRWFLYRKGLVALDHLRARSMTAEKFADLAVAAGLRCVGQERINWLGTRRLIDCISLVARPGSRWDRPNRVCSNGNFVADPAGGDVIRRLYAAESFSANKSRSGVINCV